MATASDGKKIEQAKCIHPYLQICSCVYVCIRHTDTCMHTKHKCAKNTCMHSSPPPSTHTHTCSVSCLHETYATVSQMTQYILGKSFKIYIRALLICQDCKSSQSTETMRCLLICVNLLALVILMDVDPFGTVTNVTYSETTKHQICVQQQRTWKKKKKKELRQEWSS